MTCATTPDGRVHVWSPIGGAEHTLCGIAFDACGSEKDDALQLTDTTARTVTCDQCAEVVAACRGLRIKTPNDLGNRRDAGPIGGASVLTDELAGNG